MAFSFSQDLDDALSRVRFAVGDVTSPGYFGDEIYEAVLLSAASDETVSAQRIAAGLAAKYAAEPDSVGSNGETVSWRSRVAQWNKIAAGIQLGSAITPTTYTVFSRTTRRNDGYSTSNDSEF